MDLLAGSPRPPTLSIRPVALLRSFFAALVAVLLLARPSRAARDPVADFCRIWGHQTAVIDNRLFIDGGDLNWNPISQNRFNDSNQWLLYEDLSSTPAAGMPQLYANLSKNATVPSVLGGTLFADDINKRLYLWGGQYPSPGAVQLPSLYSYDAINDYWVASNAPPSTISQVAYGAGASISELGVGYYFGGWQGNLTTQRWNGPDVAVPGLLKYTYATDSWVNNTGPDGFGRADGSMVFIPVGDGGMLVYIGGVVDQAINGSFVGQPMNEILLFDVLSSKWYTQKATGTVPQMRRRFCAGAAWPDDQSSYNIYLYGGMGLPPNTSGFDDVYVLSIPSFTWTKMYPTDGNVTGAFPHHSLTCNVINKSQMFIIGGNFPLSDDCDVSNQYGTHCMDMGMQNSQGALWELYQPNLTTYAVPPPIVSVIGGSPRGGATRHAPSGGFDAPDLTILMTRKAEISAHTATRAVPGATSPPSPSGSSSHHGLSGGAIAGIVIGSLAAVGLLFGFCVYAQWRRQKRHSRQRAGLHPIVPPGADGRYAPPMAGYPNSPTHGGAPPPGWSPHMTSASTHYTPTSPYPSNSAPFGPGAAGGHQRGAASTDTAAAAAAAGHPPAELPGSAQAQQLHGTPQQQFATLADDGTGTNTTSASTAAGTDTNSSSGAPPPKYDPHSGAWVAAAGAPLQHVSPTSHARHPSLDSDATGGRSPDGSVSQSGAGYVRRSATNGSQPGSVNGASASPPGRMAQMRNAFRAGRSRNLQELGGHSQTENVEWEETKDARGGEAKQHDTYYHP